MPLNVIFNLVWYRKLYMFDCSVVQVSPLVILVFDINLEHWCDCKITAALSAKVFTIYSVVETNTIFIEYISRFVVTLCDKYFSDLMCCWEN